MRLYLDSEFAENGKTIDLISIAVVSESGPEFYRQNSQADFRSANAWVPEHVIPALWACPQGMPGPRHVYGLCVDPTCVWRPKRNIRDDLLQWLSTLGNGPFEPEFWGYYADYDWVALCQLFGRMVDLPTGWPMYCRDLKQYADDLLGPESINLDEMVPITNEHHALADARWNREAHRFLLERERSYYAGNRKGRSWPVHKERSHVRSAQAEGDAEVAGGGDLERPTEQDRQARQAPVEEREVNDAIVR